MTGKGKRRGGEREEGARRSRSRANDNDDSSDGEKEPEKPPPFVLSGDNTGSGIDYNTLDEGSWKTLHDYCQKWGIKQAHLESIYARFERTIVRTEHLDFTLKPKYHVSLDFLADEMMSTSGEFAGQMFIQTWFLRHKRGLPSPKDRRCVDFTRLVIMSCDLARLGDFELLVNLWACVLHRFGHLLPAASIDLDTHLNTELVEEVISVIHAYPDKKFKLLVTMLLAEAREYPDEEHAIRVKQKEEGTPEANGREEDAGEVEGEKGEDRLVRRYLTLRSILRFGFQYPPLLFPVVQFQRILRSKIIGTQYWLRRRKPTSERGVNLSLSLGLPDAYNDIFDRIERRRDAWVVASGHIMFNALDANTAFSSSFGEGEGSREEELDKRYRQLLDNCLLPAWYNKEETIISGRKLPIPAISPRVVGGRLISSLTSTATCLQKTALARAKSRRPVFDTKKVGKNIPGNVSDMGVEKAEQPPSVDTYKLRGKPGFDGKRCDREKSEEMPSSGGVREKSDGVADTVLPCPSGSSRPLPQRSYTTAVSAVEVGTLEHATGVSGAGAYVDGNRKGTGGDNAQPQQDSARPTELVSCDSKLYDDDLLHLENEEPTSDTTGSAALHLGPRPTHAQEGGGEEIVCTEDSVFRSNVPLALTGSEMLTPLHWPVGNETGFEQDFYSGQGGRSPGRSGRHSRKRDKAHALPEANSICRGGGIGNENFTDDSPSKTCAVCLKRPSRVAMCRKCGRRAAKALKDAEGSRQARAILVPFGDAFGVLEADALEMEGDNVRRWVRLYDDEAGADFFYNVHFDSSVWRGDVELPKPKANPGTSRRRKSGRGVKVSAPGDTPPLVDKKYETTAASSSTPALLHKARTSSATATTSACTPTATSGGDRGRSALSSRGGGRATFAVGATAAGRLATPTTKKTSAGRPTRVVVLTADEGSEIPAPEVVLDVHKLIYPKFRLVSQKDAAAAAEAKKGLNGATPLGGDA